MSWTKLFHNERMQKCLLGFEILNCVLQHQWGKQGNEDDTLHPNQLYSLAVWEEVSNEIPIFLHNTPFHWSITQTIRKPKKLHLWTRPLQYLANYSGLWFQSQQLCSSLRQMPGKEAIVEKTDTLTMIQQRTWSPSQFPAWDEKVAIMGIIIHPCVDRVEVVLVGRRENASPENDFSRWYLHGDWEAPEGTRKK